MKKIIEKISIGGIENIATVFETNTGYRIIVSKFKDTNRLALLVGFKNDMKLISYHNKLNEKNNLLLYAAKTYLSINDAKLVQALL